MAAQKKAAKPKSESARESPREAARPVEAAKPYVVFARRFRPQTFADVAGQTAVTSALRQALMSGRVAQAYLLCGPRGVGKTSLARIFAKACNCLNGKGPGGAADEPCNTCSACVSIGDGSSLDVIEMDAATNRGIEEVRSLRDNVAIAPAELRYKVYIIDEVHMLTREAWNAFLKTLEEPPAHVKFIFATTDPNDVPETILSRCQRFDLKRISLSDIMKRLRKICEIDKVDFEEAALSRIAGLAKGGLRDAEGLLDQAVNLGGGKVTDAIVRELSGAAPDELLFDMLKACAAGKAAEVLAMAHGALENGADPDDMLAVLSERLRCTVLAKVCGAESPLLEGQTHLKDSYAELGKLLNEGQCLMLIQIFTNARRQMRDAAQTRLPLEVALIRAARARDLVDLSKLASALEANAGKTPQGGAAPNRPPTVEAPRPNWAGRPATDSSQPAADARGEIRDSNATRAPAGAGSETFASSGNSLDKWPRVIEGVKAQRATILATALSHAAVAVDLDEGVVALGSDQQFYRDTLNQPQNQLALKNILSEVYGCELELRITDAAKIRAAGQNNAVAPPVRAAFVAAPAPKPSPAAWEPRDEDVTEEYRDDGSLGLDEPLTPQEGDAAPLETVESDDAPAGGATKIVPPRVAAPRAPDARLQLDARLVEDHPLVQLILKATGGTVLEVARTKKGEENK